jgi:hypothetical protein
MMALLNRSEDLDQDAKTVLLEGIQSLKENFADFDLFKYLVSRYNAEWSIHLGKYMNRVKELARKAGLLWEVWAGENLPFIGKHNRSKFMNLARRTGCHKFSFLGVDRLDILCSATAESKDLDPIKSFIERHSIRGIT